MCVLQCAVEYVAVRVAVYCGVLLNIAIVPYACCSVRLGYCVVVCCSVCCIVVCVAVYCSALQCV